jgi:DnaJ-class molecular chaperone
MSLKVKDSGALRMENRKDKTSIPEKYGMISCPQCNGLGKLLRSGKGPEVCMICGGFGAIKAPQTHGTMESWENGILGWKGRRA